MNYVGAVIGFWLFYALIALLFKHKAAITIMIIIGVVGGIASAVSGSYALIAGTAIGAPLTLACAPLQVKSAKKEQWKAKQKKHQTSATPMPVKPQKDKSPAIAPHNDEDTTDIT